MTTATVPSTYTILGRNTVHPFPARMAPELALSHMAHAERSLTVLDPMAGSGTVLALAQARGHRAIGFDLDPLAVLISQVWTRHIDRVAVRDKAVDVLGGARQLFAKTSARKAYPAQADQETRQFLRYWFDGYVRRQLTSLATTILAISEDSVRDVLWCGLSRMVIAKRAGVSRAMDLSHSRPHRVFRQGPIKPFNAFLSAVEQVTKNCLSVQEDGAKPEVNISEGDARALPIERESVDLILTSPPYLNAIDYMRCSKFSLVWMGYSTSPLRRLRSSGIGAEVGSSTATSAENQSIMSDLGLFPKLNRRQESILTRYIEDIRRVVEENARVLRAGGKAVYVVGDNTVRGTVIRNSRIIERVASAAGLQTLGKTSRDLPANRRYLPPPSEGSESEALNGRIRREVVLTFVKNT